MKSNQVDTLPPAHDPRMVQLWLKGAEAPTEVIFASRSEATTFAHAMYRLRTALTRAHHEAAPKARQAKIAKAPYIEHPGDLRWKVTIYPISTRFDAALKAAGLEEEEPPDLA